MKSKVKYAVLVLVIGLLGLAILASPVFGGKPEPYKYNIKIVDIKGKTVVEFVAYGSKDGTRIVGYEKFQMGYVPVSMNFPKSLVPDKNFRTSTIPGVGVQDLNSDNLEYGDSWKYHSGRLYYSENTLSFRFDLYIYYDQDGLKAHDHYILGIEMDLCTLQEVSYKYCCTGNATLNWTHYTEPVKPRGKNLQVKFQQLKQTTEGELTITITRL